MPSSPQGPLERLEARGVHLEADGSIVLERARIAPPPTAAVETERPEHVVYPVANPALAATFENPGLISSYQVYAVGPVLEAGGWRLVLVVDGGALVGYPAQTRVRGRAMAETWQDHGCRITVTSFCDGERNAIYQIFRAENLDDRPHTVEALIRASLLADPDRPAPAVQFDERLQAIVGEIAPARALLLGADRAPREWRLSDQRAYLTYRLDLAAHETGELCLVVTGGWSRAEQEALFAQATRGWRQALDEARRYADWLSARLDVADPTLRSLFAASLNCGLSAYHEDRGRRLPMLLPSAEADLGRPATLPCDAYWCAQVLLPFRPDQVRAQILALAGAVGDDGSLPRVVGPGASPQTGPAAVDSPSYLALLVHDYLAWTDDRQILEARQGGRTVWEKVLACIDGLRARDRNHDYLFEKGRDETDWAYDVRRDDWVTYDLALHCQATRSALEIALLRGEQGRAQDLSSWARGVQQAINRHLWHEAGGYYVDYRRSYMGIIEDHAAIDTVVAALFGVATDRMAHRHLAHLERTLETARDDRQYYGDWGVMSCFPFYREREDLGGRSAWAYSYHNGAAWPGWCGVYALAKLLHRQEGWRYPLERWWTYALEHYWFTPTEYYAPPYDAPALRRAQSLYAWSSMAAAAVVLGGFGFWPNLSGEVVLRVPPWGDSRLSGIRFRGEVYDVEAREGVVSLLQNGDRIASSPQGMRIRLGRVAVR